MLLVLLSCGYNSWNLSLYWNRRSSLSFLFKIQILSHAIHSISTSQSHISVSLRAGDLAGVWMVRGMLWITLLSLKLGLLIARSSTPLKLMNSAGFRGLSFRWKYALNSSTVTFIFLLFITSGNGNYGIITKFTLRVTRLNYRAKLYDKIILSSERLLIKAYDLIKTDFDHCARQHNTWSLWNTYLRCVMYTKTRNWSRSSLALFPRSAV